MVWVEPQVDLPTAKLVVHIHTSLSYQNTICEIQVTFCALVPNFSRGMAIYHERLHPLYSVPSQTFVSSDTKARIEARVRVECRVTKKDLQLKISWPKYHLFISDETIPYSGIFFEGAKFGGKQAKASRIIFCGF